MQATIDIRMARPHSLEEDKFLRMLDIVEQEVSDEFPSAIVRVRASSSISDISVFGLGKSGKSDVTEFLENLFENGSAFSELEENYY